MMRLSGLICVFVLLWISKASSQVGQIWIDPAPEYSPPGKYVQFSITCINDLVGLKAIHMDLDIDPAVLGIVPDSIQIGDLFVDNDSITFYYQYVVGDSSRLTVDIAVLPDSATISGPGNLLFFRLFTKALGESNITLAGLDVRDRFNQSIAVTGHDGYIQVCQFVGDVNGDYEINIADLVYLVDWSFRSGPAPTPPAAGDIDCNNSYDIADITELVNYMFRQGSLCGPCINI
jgi:hypothetical protein